MTTDYFKRLAAYNRWANGRLYDACAALPEAEYKRDRGAFFRSIHGTLNHILVGDRIWLGRIQGRPHGIDSLDQELYPDLPSLRAARQEEDERIAQLVGGYGDADLDDVVRYDLISLPGETAATPLRLVLGHLFNHQTHHRGQAHDLLSQAGVAPPPLDLIFFLREAA